MSLEAHDIAFGYVPGHLVLDGAHLVVNPGERVALTAPSGRGKTTFCRVLAGYLLPARGTVRADGLPVATRAAGAPRPVQLIWQHPEQAFDPLLRMRRSLVEGLAGSEAPMRRAHADRRSDCVGRSDHGCRSGRAPRPWHVRHFAQGRAEALDSIRATGLLDRFGIREAWLERFPHELSGGELMRFCIVRALLAEPRYLICDEMTAMLDAVTQAELWRAVIEIADERDMGIVLVSHSPALVARVATREVALGAHGV